MNHIKKKYLTSIPHSMDLNLLESIPIDHEKVAEIRNNNMQGYYPMLVTDNAVIQAFSYTHKHKQFFIPEPNPIILYFHVAQIHLKEIATYRADLFLEFDKKKPDLSKTMNISYNYFSAASTCAIFLFNSLEAFINLLIPEDYNYNRVSNTKTETFNKSQIQRYIQFEEKVKVVIPKIKSSNFQSQHSHKYERILKLKSLRDEIVHTKTHLEHSPNWYKILFTQLLDSNFESFLKDCRDYINFYQPHLIEECDCGANY